MRAAFAEERLSSREQPKAPHSIKSMGQERAAL